MKRVSQVIEFLNVPKLKIFELFLHIFSQFFWDIFNANQTLLNQSNIKRFHTFLPPFNSKIMLCNSIRAS